MVFAGLSKSENDELISYVDEVRTKRGDNLFRPGDVADSVYFLKSGKIGVQTSTGFEDRQQIVALLDPGAAVGEKGLCTDDSRKMTVVAIKDCTFYSLDKEAFARLEKSNPDLAIKILKNLLNVSALRLQASSERLAHVL